MCKGSGTRDIAKLGYSQEGQITAPYIVTLSDETVQQAKYFIRTVVYCMVVCMHRPYPSVRLLSQ